MFCLQHWQRCAHIGLQCCFTLENVTLSRHLLFQTLIKGTCINHRLSDCKEKQKFCLIQNTCWQCKVCWAWFNVTRTVFFCWNTITKISWSYYKCIILCIVASACSVIFGWVIMVHTLSFFIAKWFRVDTITHTFIGLKFEWLVTHLFTLSSGKRPGKYSLTSWKITQE